MRVKCEGRRQAIIDVAQELFQEKGFELTSMSEITARVGGSKATLYSYFASKEELFLAVMHHYAEEDIRRLFDGLDVQQDLRECLLQFGQAFIDFISQPKVIAAQRVLFAESGRTDIGKRFFDRGPCDGGARLAEFLRRCSAGGKLGELEPAVAARHLISLLKSEIMEPLLFGAFEREQLPATADVVRRAVDVFLRAYAPK
jgi:AcrR family transcriptional regulator